MTRTTRMLCLLHLAANALLLWLGYEWLGVGESTVPRLIWSTVDALLILALTCWLWGATLVYFRDGHPRINDAFRAALRSLVPLLVAALAVLAVYGYLSWWAGYSSKPAFKLASWLTLQFRKPVKPATVQSVFDTVLWMVRWALLPSAVLPMFSGVASRGWRGVVEYGWRRHSRFYRLEVPLLLLCGLWLPFRLLAWMPGVHGFWMEMASFALRLLVAYLLFVGACVRLSFLTSRGRPVASQLKTVVSP